MTASGPAVYVDEESGARYLEDISYERMECGGWKIPDSERARCDQPVRGEPRTVAAPMYRDFDNLVAELAYWLFLDHRLKAQLKELYNRDPVRATRMVERVVTAASAGGLSSPDGYLASLLKQERDGEIGQEAFVTS